MLTSPVSPSSLLAFATTVHLGLAALRNHRSQSAAPISPLALVSFACCALPWVLTSSTGLVVGFGIHGTWFLACEWLIRKPAGADIPLARPARSNTTSIISHAPPAAQKPSTNTPPPPRPKNFIQVPVLATLDETADIKTIRFARPEGFDFMAG